LPRQLFEHYRPLVAAAQAKPEVIAYYVGTSVNDETETEIVVFELYATQPWFMCSELLSLFLRPTSDQRIEHVKVLTCIHRIGTPTVARSKHTLNPQR
jgi:hypothetical protein